MKTYPLPLLAAVLLAACQVHMPTLDEVGPGAMPAEIAPIEGAPFDMPAFSRPVFPDLTVDIGQRGAQPDSLVTDIINQAIRDVHHAGGGTVLIPAGHFFSGRIELLSDVNLHLDAGAQLEFSARQADYQPPVFSRYEGIEVMSPGAFIYACHQSHIALTGNGTIVGPPQDAEVRQLPPDGYAIESLADTPVDQRIADGKDGHPFFRPMTFSPTCCTDVFVEGIHVSQSAFWNIVPVYCQHVVIRGITVETVGVLSGDGIDIESSTDVLIEYCSLSCGDDCFTLKAGRGYDGLRVGRPTERVVVRHCLAREGHGGLTCGSETAGQVHHVYLHDCVFAGTRSGLRFKTRRTRAGGIHHVLCRRVSMTNVGYAIEFDLLGSARWMGQLASRDTPQPVGQLTPVVRDICISHFNVDQAEHLLTLNGIPEMPCTNLRIEHGHITAQGLIPALNDADSITFSHLHITTTDDSQIRITDSRHVRFDHVHFDVPDAEPHFDIQGSRSTDIVCNGVGMKKEERGLQAVR